MRRHVISILIISGILTGLYFVVVRSTMFISFYLPKYVAENYDNLAVRSVEIGQQSYAWPDKYSLSQVKFIVDYKDRPYHIQIGRFTIYDVVNLEQRGRQARVLLEGVSVQGELLRAENCDFRLLVDLKEGKVVRFNGVMRGQIVAFAHYQLEGLAARVKGNSEKLQVFEASVMGYGGTGRGQFSLSYEPNPEVVLWLEMYALDAVQLRGIGKGVFKQVEGLVDTNFRIIKKNGEITLMAATFDLGAQGKVMSGLVKTITDKIADTEVRLKMSGIEQSLGYVPVDRASVHLQMTGPHRLVLMYSLDNRAYNLAFKEAAELILKDDVSKFILTP